MSNLFIGVDAGGTHTRALVADEGGMVVGTGLAAGANSWSSGTPVADVVADAVAEAMRGHDPGAVAYGVIGIAGGGASSARIAAELAASWQGLKLPGAPEIVLDVLAAFAAGTSAPYGLVITAGTGSIAARVSDRRVERRAGGHGFLVGDEGSAVWLGVGAIRAALRALDGRGPETALTGVVIDGLEIPGGSDEERAGAIVHAAYSRPPAQLGALAPQVVAAAEANDAVAARLAAQAAEELAGIGLAAAGDHAPSAVVLGGSLLTKAEPIQAAVRSTLAEAWPHATITITERGAAGAAALAICRHAPERFGERTRERLLETHA